VVEQGTERRVLLVLGHLADRLPGSMALVAAVVQSVGSLAVGPPT
jgi:hypothetical protein